MNTSKTISVEPGKITLAERKNKEKHAEFMRMSILGSSETSSRKVNALNLIFPSQKEANYNFNKFSIPLRSVFAAILIAAGATTLQSGLGLKMGNETIGILQIVFGAMLALGLFTRFAMAASATMMMVVGISAMRIGISDISAFSLMFGSALFFVMGAGKYSCDTIIKKAIIRKKIAEKRKNQQDCMGYKAFSCVSRNI